MIPRERLGVLAGIEAPPPLRLTLPALQTGGWPRCSPACIRDIYITQIVHNKLVVSHLISFYGSPLYFLDEVSFRLLHWLMSLYALAVCRENRPTLQQHLSCLGHNK